MPPDPTQEILKEVRALLVPLKRYKVEAVLGSGAMGSVVLVRHDVLGLRALKLINPNYLKSETLLRRFFKEATVMSRLRGRHIVEVYEVDDVQGYPYIVMEYLEGGTLFDHLAEFGPMPTRQAVQVTVALLEALETAHTHCDEEGKLSPIVHRDVKAENVLLTKGGTPKLGDFGIAHMEGGTRQLTGDITTLGTFAYMAPEQRDARNVDGRADLYAVAVTLYIMLTNPEKLWVDPFHTALARNPDMMEGVPESLHQLIGRAVAEKREDRYESTQVMAVELRTVFASLPENPENTARLGTAPEVAAKRKATEHVTRSVVSPVPEGEVQAMTSVPEQGDHSSGGGLSTHGDVLQLRSVQPPSVATSSSAEQPMGWEAQSGTFHEGGTHSGTQFERELDHTRGMAKRRFFMGVGGISAVLVIVGVSIWYTKNLDDEVELLPVVTEVQPESIGHEVIPTVVTTQPETVEADPVSTQVTPAPPTKIEKKVPKAATPVDREAPPPEKAPVSEKAQIRLILKEETIAMITLTGESGTFTLSPEDTSIMVPPGTYRASVQMEGREGTPQTGTLTVTPGITTITCIARFTKCTGLK